MGLPGGSSSDFHHGFPGSTLSRRDLWWTKSDTGTSFYAYTSGFPLSLSF